MAILWLPSIEPWNFTKKFINSGSLVIKSICMDLSHSIIEGLHCTSRFCEEWRGGDSKIHSNGNKAFQYLLKCAKSDPKVKFSS